ncbi:hypothetical protein LTR91_017389 [Friedmanniomyces endolithicus]|uniref:Uncharacterized protein n=1 Tax=Friedmanniomyces endolithicus TaxID=329885 RepID=A0AAN6K642_9PEZI|nr:hypothetical protein LTR35_003154 [Friedmanniomyces endolithicus]KAK0300523.1 hypothetical protein LTS00_000779 [Friedmanniomyces endolithicus]KAK0316394.1 hypothetical protein LTR01_000142 [Friedmanniomyces endolithicus]KAK0834569.1 hypothetical protein LTR73_000858 [Friedmanniomyces endolithicus]KAK0925323.1 hypothetical protein LTR57_004973 [Friedmanniomyces endolithicus]
MARTTRSVAKATGAALSKGLDGSGAGGGGRKPGGGGRKPPGSGVSKPSSRRKKTTKKGGSRRVATPPADVPDDDDPEHPEVGDENALVAPIAAENPDDAAGNAQEVPAAVDAPAPNVPAPDAPVANVPAPDAPAPDGPALAENVIPDAPAEAGDDQATAPVPPLASIRDSVMCPYRVGEDQTRQNTRLTGELRIHQDEDQLARLGYNACFYLNLDPNNPADETLVSTIDAWRIEKRTAAKPKAKQGWIRDFLAATPRGKKDAHWRETWYCMRALYGKDGTVQASIDDFAADLRDDGLMFIEMVHTLPLYAGRGLLAPMLTLFRSLLQQLPEWFVFDGLLVLVPAPPTGERGNVWNNVPDAEARLAAIYNRADQYIVLVEEAAVGGVAIKVMGRKVLDGDDAGNVAAGAPAQ